MIKLNVVPAPFVELAVVDAHAAPHEHDLVIESSSQIDLQSYCTLLLTKILSSNKSKIKPFIKHQCTLLNDPFTWLNKLEKLIDLNRDQLSTKDHKIKIEKALMVIELLRDEIEAGKIKPAKFDFKLVKTKLKTYQSTEEQLSYLLEAKTEYLQNKPLLVDPHEVPFDEKCELEIQLLKSKSKLRKKKTGTTPVIRTVAEKQKFRINSNLNQFVDIFFQLMHEKKVDGKPYLEASTNDIAELISSSFKDKEGNVINAETIKTILKPSRFEKRPKGSGRISIS
jgi:hypothetical protein